MNYIELQNCNIKIKYNVVIKYNMYLNPATSSLDCAFASDAKLSFNINAFNGNTTIYRPIPKSVPVQPSGEHSIINLPTRTIRPMPM